MKTSLVHTLIITLILIIILVIIFILFYNSNFMNGEPFDTMLIRNKVLLCNTSPIIEYLKKCRFDCKHFVIPDGANNEKMIVFVKIDNTFKYNLPQLTYLPHGFLLIATTDQNLFDQISSSHYDWEQMMIKKCPQRPHYLKCKPKSCCPDFMIPLEAINGPIYYEAIDLEVKERFTLVIEFEPRTLLPHGMLIDIYNIIINK